MSWPQLIVGSLVFGFVAGFTRAATHDVLGHLRRRRLVRRLAQMRKSAPDDRARLDYVLRKAAPFAGPNVLRVARGGWLVEFETNDITPDRKALDVAIHAEANP